MLAAPSWEQRTDQVLASLSDSDLFTIFAAMHIYLYLQAARAADLTIDSTQLARDRGYRQSMTRELREMTGLQLSLADAKESFRFTTADHSVINRNHIERHIRVAAGMVPKGQVNSESLQYAEQLLEGMYSEISRNSYLEPARQQFNALAKEKEKLQAVIGERDAAAAAAEARAAGAEASLAEVQHELAVQGERFADLVRERDEHAAAVAQVEAEAAGLRARIGERGAAAAAAEARAGAAEAGLAEIQHELAAQGERFADLVRERDEHAAAVAQVEAEAAGLRARIGERDAAAAAAEARASAAEAGFAQAQAEIARLRADIDQADTEMRQRGAAEFALRGDLESLRRAFNRIERERDERVGELEAVRVEVKAERAAAVAAHRQIRRLEATHAEARRESEARLAEAEQEIEARRRQLATAAEEKAEHGSAIGALKGEIAALQRDFSATKQVGHELMTAASTAAVVATQKRGPRGILGSAMLGFGHAMKTGAVVRGDRARDAKQWRLAARHYHKALARDPLDAPCWVQYGHALKESGRLPEAEAAYRQSLACVSNIADTHLQFGHVLKLQGRTMAAQAAYLRAFALDPDMSAASEELAGLGWLPMHLAQLHGLSANPDIAQLRSLRDAADAARDRRDWPEAAKLYQEFVTADPSAFDITVQLGHARKEMGDLDRAAQAYYRALEVNPLDDDLHLQIGHLEKLRRDFAAAAAHYQRAAQINPANAAARREAAALGDRVHELRPGAAGTTGSGGPAGGGSNAHDADDLRFLDARAGEIYQQLLTAMA